MRREKAPRLRSLTRKWLRLPLAQKLTIFHVLLVALFVEVAIRLAPVVKVSRLLGVPFRPADGVDQGRVLDPLELSARVRQRARLTLSIMDHWPFAEGTCLRQSLVLGHFLRRHEPVLRLGVKKENGDLAAHAWIEVGGATVGFDGSFQPFRTTV